MIDVCMDHGMDFVLCFGGRCTEARLHAAEGCGEACWPMIWSDTFTTYLHNHFAFVSCCVYLRDWGYGVLQ